MSCPLASIGDGEQSCAPSNIWLTGADYPLSATSADVNGANLAWNQPDFLNKTVRCEIFFRSIYAESGYRMEIHDTTFLDAANPTIDPAIAQLPEATSHSYNSGWSIGQFGRLEGTLISLNAREFSTERGFHLYL